MALSSSLLFLVLCCGSFQPAGAASSWNTGESNVLLQGGAKSGKPFIAASATATGRVLQVGSKELAADGVQGTFQDTEDFKCRYRSNENAAIYMETDGTYQDRRTIQCDLPEWGLQHAAATTVFSLYQNGAIVEAFGEPLSIYFGETIFAVRPNVGLSGGADVIVSGAGFSTVRKYHCVLFPLTGKSIWKMTSDTMYPKFLAKSVFTAFNSTMGQCHVAWPYAAAMTNFSVIHESEPMLSNAGKSLLGSQTVLPQPTIRSISKEGVLTFESLPFQTKEEWYAISDSVAHYSGGPKATQLTVSGHGFRKGAFSGAPYQCVFSSPNGEYNVTSEAVAIVEGSTISSTRLSCETPVWVRIEDGLSRFTLRTSSEIVAETAAYEHLVTFLDVPLWSADTPANGLVLFDGVHCNTHTHTFGAYRGLAPLRLTLDYTVMRPKHSEAFLQDTNTKAVPSLDSVKRITSTQTRVEFSDVLALDSILPGGRHSKGNDSHTLLLPSSALDDAKLKAQVKWDRDTGSWVSIAEPVGIRDNSLSPSHLVFQTKSNAMNNSVEGVLTWNVSRGWEGYAYRVCITARQVPVSRSISVFHLFSQRCIYIIVPKCQRCYTSNDNLDAIARSYGATWLDMWSVNTHLVNTTRADISQDEVFNTANDQTYLAVGVSQTVTLGLSYQLTATDKLSTVAQRFGMTLPNMLALNPDIVAANQDSDLQGKMVCILPNTAQYTTCTPQEESGKAEHYEATYRAPFFYDYDPMGAPVKEYNSRYPQPPLASPPRVPP
mmetsp:Transcript_104778/g.168678  ORF Transcript_104778/g.168678 Transcript_104778/m.168678 type:complete len:773 (+) Transcript_104778:70-2388(+)